MVASRNEERLKQAAEEMKKNISSDSLAEIDHVQCNIRKEEQVIITWKPKGPNQDSQKQLKKSVLKEHHVIKFVGDLSDR
jgi:hypothetical protein